MEAAFHFFEADQTTMLFGVFIGIEGIKPFHHELVACLNFTLVQDFEKVRLHRNSLLFLLFSFNFVSLEERLDCVDAVGDELRPGDLTVLVFVG